MDDVAVKPEYRGKRVLDIAATLVAAPVWLPIAALCAAAVKLESSGPALFRQQRVGRGGSTFELFKFRTMLHDNVQNPVLPDSRRITRVGAFLRKWSLDELPQFFNVLRGEMSLVGPRPTLEYQVQRYTAEQKGRLSVRPGLTGRAQLAGRNSIPWARRIELDNEYVTEQSLRVDLSLLLRTPLAVLSARGVTGHPDDDPIVVGDHQQAP